jgi:IS30 family transposase
MVMITERPAAAADRAVPGHWEGDLLFGQRGQSAVGTLVERSSRYVMLLRLPNGRLAEHVRVALTRRIRTLPQQLRRSLTWDQGKEMAQHLSFTVATGVQVYFCDPRSPWQRATSENTNGLLRQYLPRNADLSTLSQARLDAIARQLNQRPRHTLGWETPARCFGQAVAATA